MDVISTASLAVRRLAGGFILFRCPSPWGFGRLAGGTSPATSLFSWAEVNFSE
jgi:hypothetical protein